MSIQNSSRRFARYGRLDRKHRHWEALPPVNRTSGQFPNGDELVYAMNETFIDVGQGMSGLRGYAGGSLLVGLSCALVPICMIFIEVMLSDSEVSFLSTLWSGHGFEFVFNLFSLLLLVVVAPPLLFFAIVLSINDVFGYIDAPIRFDRIRRKVYVWASRKEGPIELDWDRLTPVAQSVSAPPYQLNQFHSVLLVDLDENGEVRFEGRIPRVAQIGASLLNGESTIAAYEYVRGFMERGPQSLPPVKTYLVMRPRGIRPFVDVFGVLGSMMRLYFSLPKHRRSPGGMAFGIIAIALFSIVALPFQWTHAIAVKWTTRVPKWPEKYDALAAEGGPIVPPPGAEPNDPPLLPHEKVIAGIWLASFVGWVAWIASW